MVKKFAAAYVLLALAYTWPLPLRLATGVIHDPYDPLLNAWILWWNTQAMPLTQHWWNAPIFYPSPGTLAFSEHLIGLSPIAAPFAFFHAPLLGYNLALLATYPLCALSAHFLVYTLTRRHDAAFVAGLAYAFAPYRLGQLPHIQVMTTYWTPLCLAALHRYDQTRKHAWIAIAAAAFLMQSLSSGYFMFFLAVLMALWFLWFALGRWPLRMFVAAACAFGVAALLLIPFLSGYQHILRDTYGFKRSLYEIRIFSADVAGLLLASEDLLLWGWVHVIQRPESGLFPGLTIVVLTAYAIYRTHPFVSTGDSVALRRLKVALLVVLAVLLVATAMPLVYGPWRLTIGGVRILSIGRADKPFTLVLIASLTLLLLLPRVRAALSRRSLLAFYVIAASLMFVCALGPDPTVMNRKFIYQAPYGQLMRLEGFDGLRVPARFWTMALACLSVVAGLAVHRFRPARRQLLVSVACAGILLDGWPRRFIVVDPPELRPSPPGVSSRIDLPINDDIDTQALYRQMFDQVPMRNGYSGYIAPHYESLVYGIDTRDHGTLADLAADKGLFVALPVADRMLDRFVSTHPGATRLGACEGMALFLIAPEAPLIRNERPLGTTLPIASLTADVASDVTGWAIDGDLNTRWHSGQQLQDHYLQADLGTERSVSGAVFELGPSPMDFPRFLRVKVSLDGSSWTEVWAGATHRMAFRAGLSDPKRMPLVISFVPAPARYVRFEQTGRDQEYWSVPELRILSR